MKQKKNYRRDIIIRLLCSMMMVFTPLVTSTIAQETFTVATLNVDGLPNNIAGISVNPDGPGTEGTQKISQYLANKGYDIISCQEDFNHHGSLVSALGNYNQAYFCGALAVGSISLGGLQIDNDGLMLLWKNNLNVVGDIRTAWTDYYGTLTNGNDGLVKKGYRFYEATVGNGTIVDIYILHMDADSDAEDIAARESQLRQLLAGILQANANHPKIIMGDTNCRYTREQLKSILIDGINSTGNYTAADAWVETCKNGVYPTYGTGSLMVDDLGLEQGEVVDKIIYINPKNGDQIKLKHFQVNGDYVDESGNLLGDHRPLEATFEIEEATYPPTASTEWFEGEDFTTGSVNWYVYNLGTATFVGDNGTLYADINAAEPWGIYGSYTISKDDGDRFYLEYRITWSAGIRNSSATTFNITKDGSISGSYNIKYRITSISSWRYFNVDDQATSSYSAATTNGPWNDWWFISIAQRDAYNEYLEAFYEASQYARWPLPECLGEDLIAALNEAGNTNYSKCKGDNGTTAKLKAAVEAIKAWTEQLMVEDYTASISNPSFENSADDMAPWYTYYYSEGWQDSGVRDNGNATYTMTPADGQYIFNTWNSEHAGNGEFYCYQNITLPAGYYQLDALLASDQGNTISLVMGDNKTPFVMANTLVSSQRCQSILYYHNGGELRIGAYSNSWFKADDFHLTKYNDYYDVTIGSALYASLSLPWNTTIPAGVSVYTSDEFDPATHKINLVEVNDILPLATGVILKATTPGTYRFIYSCNTNEVNNNILESTHEGRLPQADRDEVNNAYYVLANRNDHVAMYRLGTATIPQYRAYLMLPISEANTMAGIIERVTFGIGNDGSSVVSDDGGFVDGISHHATDVTVTGIYAPNGSRLQGMQKGVNIIQMSNGTTKKVTR